MSTEAEVRIVTSGKRSGVGADRNSDGPVFVERRSRHAIPSLL
jgi:hypothetical protein